MCVCVCVCVCVFVCMCVCVCVRTRVRVGACMRLRSATVSQLTSTIRSHSHVEFDANLHPLPTRVFTCRAKFEMRGLRPALNKNWSCVDRCPRNGGYINVYATGGILRAQELCVLREKKKFWTTQSTTNNFPSQKWSIRSVHV